MRLNEEQLEVFASELKCLSSVMSQTVSFAGRCLQSKVRCTPKSKASEGDFSQRRHKDISVKVLKRTIFFFHSTKNI